MLVSLKAFLNAIGIIERTLSHAMRELFLLMIGVCEKQGLSLVIGGDKDIFSMRVVHVLNNATDL